MYHTRAGAAAREQHRRRRLGRRRLYNKQLVRKQLGRLIGNTNSDSCSIIAANYGGTLNVYSHSGKRLITRKFRDDSLRCVGAFETRQGF